MEGICALHEATKSYGAVQALGPVSMTLYPGEFVGLRGDNGAGKSTLLKLLAGLFAPDSGSRVISPELKGLISYVPQDVALYETMTATENLRFWGMAYGLPAGAVKARANWLLERLELTEKANVPAGACSGGTLRRLHLASGLMVTPKLLLLDEPTVGADPHSAQLILSLLEHFHRQGCAIVMVSHRPGELEQAATHVITLKAGRIEGAADA